MNESKIINYKLFYKNFSQHQKILTLYKTEKKVYNQSFLKWIV